VIPVEFRGDLWQQKTRVSGLSCGIVCVILRLAILVELQLVTDMASRGKNDSLAVHTAFSSVQLCICNY